MQNGQQYPWLDIYQRVNDAIYDKIWTEVGILSTVWNMIRDKDSAKD